MIAEISVAASTPHAAGEHWSPAVRERVRIAYVSGSVRSVRELAEKFGVPFNTCRRWSRLEGWGATAAVVSERSDSQATQKLCDWLSEQRIAHVLTTIARGKALLAQIDRFADGKKPLTPRELSQLAGAFNTADTILRRCLGLDAMRIGAPEAGRQFALSANGVSFQA